jgi:hypothetical protein
MPKDWLRNRGYIHLTPHLKTGKVRNAAIRAYVADPERVAKHHFSPLLFKTIRERRYKKESINGKSTRAHSWVDDKGEFQVGIKDRPIHYANHLDSTIYGYYAAEELGERYEKILKSNPELSKCVTAYRRTEPGEKGKNNVHFAAEVFDLIKERKNCVAIAMDVKSFFSSLNHKMLKREWSRLLGRSSLPDDHFNLFRSITNYSYVELDDFRTDSGEFDEYQLHLNRRKGSKSFYASNADFYGAIRRGEVSIKKNQRREKGRRIMNRHTGLSERPKCGIPQGLAISSILANLYMRPFDEKMIKMLQDIGGVYRRYSDDLVILCDEKDLAIVVQKTKALIKERRLKISDPKTEICAFSSRNDSSMLTAKTLTPGKQFDVLNPQGRFTYLGFTYDGKKVLIKDKNISRYYRRMKQAIKRKVKRAASHKRKILAKETLLHRRQLMSAFSRTKKRGSKKRVRVSKLRFNRNFGEFRLVSSLEDRTQYGNFHSYARRASKIMREPAILRQLRKSGQVFERFLEEQRNSLLCK